MAKKDKKYYGQYEIIKEETIELGERVKLHFATVKDQNDEDYQPASIDVALRAYNDVVTEEPVDWNTHQTNRLNPIIKKILAILLEYNVPIGRGEGVSSDLQYILTRTNMSIEKWRGRVEDHLWGSPEESKTMAELHYHFLDSMGVDPSEEIV